MYGSSEDGFWLFAVTAVPHAPKKALRKPLFIQDIAILAVKTLSASHARGYVRGQNISRGTMPKIRLIICQIVRDLVFSCLCFIGIKW